MYVVSKENLYADMKEGIKHHQINPSNTVGNVPR